MSELFERGKLQFLGGERGRVWKKLHVAVLWHKALDCHSMRVRGASKVKSSSRWWIFTFIPEGGRESAGERAATYEACGINEGEDALPIVFSSALSLKLQWAQIRYFRFADCVFNLDAATRHVLSAPAWKYLRLNTLIIYSDVHFWFLFRTFLPSLQQGYILKLRGFCCVF